MYNATITASLYTVRAYQVARRTATVASFFLPVVIAAARAALAYLVIAGCYTIEAGMTARDWVENKLAPAIANGLNEFCYLVHPSIAPAATPIEYFPDSVETDRGVMEAVELQEPTAYNVSSVAATEPEVEQVAPDSVLMGLTIRELKKRASAAKVRRFGNMNKAQLVEALTP